MTHILILTPEAFQTLDAVLSSTTSEPQRPSEQGVQVV